MAMYEVGTVAGAANQTKVTGSSNTKWSQDALGIGQGSILVIYRNGNSDLYAIQSVDSDTQLTLTRNITTAFSGASYGIITAETASTSSFANQLASAFSLWRNVVSGWSTALTGSGNLTLTDPTTGTSVTVPALRGMMKVDGGNALTGTQNITSDNSAVIVGNNADIGIVKKWGTYGKILMGANTRFCVAKSANAQISATDDQTELFAVETNGDVKVGNSLYVSGLINSTYQIRAPSMEMSGPTPYIDFHYNSSSDDYSGRIIQDGQSQLSLVGSDVRVERTLSAGDTIAVKPNSDPGGKVGDLIGSAPLETGFRSRGGDSYTDRGKVRLFFEENIGYEHRAVMHVTGFSAGHKYWQFASNGDFRTVSGSVIARHQYGDSSPGGWYMGGRMTGIATGMSGPTGNLRFEMYARDHVGDMSSVVIECHTYQGRRDFAVNADGQIYGPLGNVPQNGSDIRLKENVQPLKDGAEDRISKLGPVEFTWSESQKKARGFIAQQVDDIDDMYAELLPEQQDRDFRILAVNDRAIMADLVSVVQNLMADRDAMRSEIESLKAQLQSSTPQ